MKGTIAANVDEYIASQPVAFIPMLVQLRDIIRAAVPEAEEVISYRLPCYKHHGMFLGFGTHKGGCSLYAMNTKILSEFADELDAKGIKYAGSTIHFDPEKKLPVVLIKKMVRARAKQNLLKRNPKST